MALTEKQRRFCEHYAATANAAAAARLAGYSERTARSQGARLLTFANVQRYIHKLQASAETARVASMQEVREYWTTTMNNTGEKTADRLRASELLARAAGAFLHFRPDPDGSGIIAAGEVDGSDVVIFVPQMLSEEECQAEVCGDE